MKVIRIKFNNGAMFEVQHATVIDHYRANVRDKWDNVPGDDPSDESLIDWMYEQMTWPMLNAVMIEYPCIPNYSMMWVYGDYRDPAIEEIPD